MTDAEKDDGGWFIDGSMADDADSILSSISFASDTSPSASASEPSASGVPKATKTQKKQSDRPVSKPPKPAEALQKTAQKPHEAGMRPVSGSSSKPKKPAGTKRTKRPEASSSAKTTPQGQRSIQQNGRRKPVSPKPQLKSAQPQQHRQVSNARRAATPADPHQAKVAPQALRPLPEPSKPPEEQKQPTAAAPRPHSARDSFHAFIHTPWGVGARRLLRPGTCGVLWHQLLSFLVHAFVFVNVAIVSLWMVQTSLRPEQPLVFYTSENSGWTFVASIWDSTLYTGPFDGSAGNIVTSFGEGMALVNLLFLMVAYLVLIVAVNRFWIATWMFFTAMMVYAIADGVKIDTRLEPILPADLSFVSGDNAGALATFIPDDFQPLVHGAIIVAAVSFVLMLLLNHFDCRRSVIASPAHGKLCAGVRCALLCVILSFSGCFLHGMGQAGSWSDSFLRSQGYTFFAWHAQLDARQNGAIVSFAELAENESMGEPDGYSKEKMQEIYDRYAAEADTINATRSQNMTDSTVVMVLSESFADPSWVPGIEVNEDATPFLHTLQTETTSGRMLSSGYGGGTANMEYMSLTGLTLANFSSSISTPYQQLVPTEPWTPSFNQAWGEGNSLGMHPYESTMYSRPVVYRRFGFRSFRSTTTEGDVFEPQDRIDSNPYISDDSAYKGVLSELIDHPEQEFISLITMQNHMPHGLWYADNQFVILDPATGEPLSDEWAQYAAAYLKGLSYSDEALERFLERLDGMVRPVTVIWYGDHYPSVFEGPAEDESNTVAMHETPYFIWSNTVSESVGTKLIRADSAYTSPNYFMAQVAEHMDARVSPYLAFLTRMHEQIPAIATGISDGNGTGVYYMDSDGSRITEDEMTDEQRTMLEDYKLIQYDITTGKNYLKNTAFMDLPEASS